MDIRKRFGQNVKRLRTASSLSQEQLSHLAEVDRTYIPSIEKGNRNVSIVVAERIAVALGVTIQDLFE
jgi:transcriptional regulator with XRE-family HTH domain